MVYFQTKNPNLGKFWNVHAMEDVGVLYGHLVNFTAIGYNYWLFAIIHFHVLVCCSKKYLATLFGMRWGAEEVIIKNYHPTTLWLESIPLPLSLLSKLRQYHLITPPSPRGVF
jgi:hypothetical protein